MKTVIILLLIALMTGCTYYQAAPGGGYYASGSSKFDQSWSAANGAFLDQGVQITDQNRGTGIIQGIHNGTKVIVNVDTQTDGSVHVKFDTLGKRNHSRTLINRIHNSYEIRMGR